MLLCPNCGNDTPAGARFCPRCGAPQPQTDPGATPPETPPAVFVPGDGWELCEIVWWRGYVKSEFYVVAAGRELARSRRFRWRSGEAPPDEHEGAREAHAELVQRLTAAGWEPLGEATPWYAQRFRRQSGLRLLAREPGEADDQEGSAQSRTRSW